MNIPVKIALDRIDLAGCRHWSSAMPYRAIVAIDLHAGVVRYQVAGSNTARCGGEKALREAMKIHGGDCHYCRKPLSGNAPESWTLDHIEPTALGGRNNLPNLVIACQPCNAKKGHMPIDAYNPQATREWLEALRKQIDGRLENLPPT